VTGKERKVKRLKFKEGERREKKKRISSTSINSIKIYLLLDVSQASTLRGTDTTTVPPVKGVRGYKSAVLRVWFIKFSGKEDSCLPRNDNTSPPHSFISSFFNSFIFLLRLANFGQ
jgi:hypothetical protein